MTYPKAIMKKTEMVKLLGFSKIYLDRACHSKYAPEFIIRNGSKGNFYIDTEKFEKLQVKGVFRV